MLSPQLVLSWENNCFEFFLSKTALNSSSTELQVRFPMHFQLCIHKRLSIDPRAIRAHSRTRWTGNIWMVLFVLELAQVLEISRQFQRTSAVLNVRLVETTLPALSPPKRLVICNNKPIICLQSRIIMSILHCYTSNSPLPSPEFNIADNMIPPPPPMTSLLQVSWTKFGSFFSPLNISR